MREEEILRRLDRIETVLQKMSGEEITDQEPVKEVDMAAHLLERVRRYKDETKDREYLSYLSEMEGKIFAEQLKLHKMRDNLDVNHATYLRKQEEALQAAAAPAPAESIPPANEEIDGTAAEEVVVVPAPEEEKKVSEAAPAPEAVEAREEELLGHSVFERGEDEYSKTWHADEAKKAEVPKPVFRSMEFNFGGIVLSVVGAVLVILSMVMFGKNFMDNLAQGVALYIIGLVVIAFSELVISRHLESFCRVVSGIGLGILYTATILNYLYLKTMKAPLAIIITLVISVGALFFARKKDSGFLRIIGILGCYISFLPLQSFDSVSALTIPCVILLIVNCLYLMLPNRTQNKALPIVHCVANVLLSLYFAVVLMLSGRTIRDGSVIPMTVFLSGLLVINRIIALQNKETALTVVSLCAEAILGFLQMLAMIDSEQYIIGLIIALAALGGCFFLDRKFTRLRWVHLYVFSILLVGVCAGKGTEDQGILISAAIVLAIFKLLSRFEETRYANLAVSVLSGIVFIANAENTTNLQFVILGIMVLSTLFLQYFKTAQEAILLVMLEAYARIAFDTGVAVLLGLAFLVLFLLLLQFFEQLRDEHIGVLRIMATITAVLLFMEASLIADYRYISLTGVLVLGLITIFLLFGNVFKLGGENAQWIRNLCMAIFFTYMVFIFRIEKPVVTSILLMVLAILSVACGFGFRQKPLRLYGLFLALFVCARLLLVDFSDSSASDKVVLTFVVGVLAIGISYLYMRLEKKENTAGPNA